MIEQNIWRYVKRWIRLVVIALVVFNLPFTTIQSTERGIVYRLWAVQDQMLTEWLHLLIPFVDDVKKVSIVPTQLSFEIPVGSAWAITKDNQTIGTDITVFYKFKESDLINIAKNFWYDVLVSKVTKDVNESFKQTIGNYTIFDVAQNQDKIRRETMSWALAKLGAYPITIEDIKVTNYDWSEAFDQQIAATMAIAQQTKQQEQELKKIEITSQKVVKEAEANKQAEALNAEALKLKGEGIRDYNQAITANPKNMELEIALKKLEIEKILAEKWDWKKVPDQVWTSTPISFNPLQ